MAIEPHSNTSKLLEKLSELLADGANINHEELKGLLGGEPAGHYHLTSGEVEKLAKLITLLFPDGDETYPEIDHEKLKNLKGGNSGGHYHLTDEELRQLTRLCGELFDSTGRTLQISHEDDLVDLLGGASSGHYHLTRAQLTKLENLPATPIGTTVEVINNLTSVSTTAALSAYQGRVLDGKISGKLDATAVNSESWTFTLEDNSTVTKKVMLSAV